MHLNKIKITDQKQMDKPDLWKAASNSDWREYSEALSFAKGLNLSGKDDWDRYVTSKNIPSLPHDIPPDPDVQYRFIGWKSWEEWLGIPSPELFPGTEPDEPDIFKSNVDPGPWMDFKSARDIVRMMGFEYKEEWQVYVEGSFQGRVPLPENIPKDPDQMYRFAGWKSWNDWLVSPDRKVFYTDFNTSRDFIRSMKFLNKESWRTYITGEEPLHLKFGFIIPRIPELEYSREWVSWDDWLGKEIEFRSYCDTRKFVHSLGLKGEDQWRSYCSGKLEKLSPKPENVFSYPEIAYKDSGWISWEDWLGPGNSCKNSNIKYNDFVECRCKGRIKDCPECDGKGYLRENSNID